MIAMHTSLNLYVIMVWHRWIFGLFAGVFTSGVFASGNHFRSLSSGILWHRWIFCLFAGVFTSGVFASGIHFRSLRFRYSPALLDLLFVGRSLHFSSLRFRYSSWCRSSCTTLCHCLRQILENKQSKPSQFLHVVLGRIPTYVLQEFLESHLDGSHGLQIKRTRQCLVWFVVSL